MKILDLISVLRDIDCCKRCKKRVKKDKLQWVGNHGFCANCINPEDQRFPEYLVLRTPSMEDSSAYQLKTFFCERCYKEEKNYYFCQLISNQRVCFACVQKSLSQFRANKKNYNPEKPIFYYPMIDFEEERNYWHNAIQESNLRRQKSNNPDLPEELSRVDAISISVQDDPLYSDDECITLYVCSNEKRNIWCFRLENDFISGWDGWPVYMGGFITPEQFLEHMKRIGNHYYDALLDFIN